MLFFVRCITIQIWKVNQLNCYYFVSISIFVSISHAEQIEWFIKYI